MDPYNAAREICSTLFSAGYTAYFAGGFVRDRLQGIVSDEIDIATSAPPKIIQSLFLKTIPVGIAFGVVIVIHQEHAFEVSTFRKDHPYHDGRHPDGVDFSTPEKDAERRDFTINGMFFDPLSETIYDFVGGKEDLKAKVIRAIGDPKARFEEDRLRMVRAVRFAARLNFTIDSATADAIHTYATALFPAVSIERIWQELSKMAAYPHFDRAMQMLHKLGLLQVIFPQLAKISSEELAKRVSPFLYFPLSTPTMAYLLELFPQASLADKLELCLYLKTSSVERKLVEFFHEASLLMEQEKAEDHAWAHFYAHPLSELFLQIRAAKNPPSHFLEHHAKRRKALAPHIARIQTHVPLVTSEHLSKLGVKPGKKMGQLLKSAEKIAINENLHDPEEVLKRLQHEISDL